MSQEHPQAVAFVPYASTPTAELSEVRLDEPSTTAHSSNSFDSSSGTSTTRLEGETSQSQAQSNAMAQQFAVALGQQETERPSLPFGARAAPIAAPVNSSTSAAAASSSTSSSSSSSRSGPAASTAILRSAYLARTPPPPLPEYQVLGQNKAVGLGRIVWAGLKVFNAMEFVGEVFADFFGLYDSRYQYVVDAYDRNKRELEFERAERAALRREQREEKAREEERNEPSVVRAERNRAEQAERAKSKAATSSSASLDEHKQADVLPEEHAV